MQTLKPIKSKLTLSVRTDLVAYGKRLAEREGRSLSKLLEDYLEDKRSAEQRERTASTSGKRFADLDIDPGVAGLVAGTRSPVNDFSHAELRAGFYAGKAK